MERTLKNIDIMANLIERYALYSSTDETEWARKNFPTGDVRTPKHEPGLRLLQQSLITDL